MRIGVLGPFEVRGDDGSVADVPGVRLRALLAALALEPDRLVPATTLIDWIWGEQPPADAANALQRLVSRLRKALPEGVVEGQAGGYRLRVRPDAVDAVRFERLLSQARAAQGPLRVRLLREALALWRGAAMQDVGLEESAAFGAAVTRLDGLRLAAQEDRFDAELSLGHGTELVTELTDLVAAHPLRERLAAALMRALVAAGRNAEALLAYESTRQALAAALGADPSPELSALHTALLRGELGRHEDTRKTNLRAELTSFVGRETDVAGVRGLIARHRLTTLTGPGGSGKTRLATETARTLDPADGAWLVDLAAIGAGGEVAQAALTALGLRDALLGGGPDGDLTGRLIAAMREREALLILDNCEHVIESAAAFASRVLGECQRMRILATSREPLGITGEALWPVAPLAVPEPDASPGEIESAPAVRLLLDRARAVRKDIAADARTLPVLARVCQALDGMPLAIELATARLRTMSIDQLASRLGDRFSLLTTGSRTALPRHKTLRAVVDWSWELLTDAERMVLRRLAVFSGGASQEAAERVSSGAGVEREQVPELLSALAEKSLLLTDGDHGPRYRMTGTVKEYAAQRLAEAGESDLARRAHLAFFTELAETADPHLRRAEQLEWLATLEAERDNLGSAMRYALTDGDAHAAMRLAAGAGWYWWLSGRAEGMELITAAARMPGEVPDETRAVVYALATHFVTSGRGDQHQAADWIHKAYEFSRRGQPRSPVLRLVVPLERMVRAPDDFLPAWESLLDDEDPWIRAIARLQHGKLRIVLGQPGRDADADLEAALTEFRALGERFGIWFALTELAEGVTARGEFAAACQYYDEAIAVVTELGAVEEVIRLRSQQAKAYWLLGDPDSCAAAIAEAQRCAERATWPDALAELALAKAELARWSGDVPAARQQLGVAVAKLGDSAEQPNVRALINDQSGYLADDLSQARQFHAAALQAAAEAGYPAALARALVGVADLAVRLGQYEQAARLLAASDRMRGRRDLSLPDAARVERIARSRLGALRFAEAASEGTRTGWAELAGVTLAS